MRGWCVVTGKSGVPLLVAILLLGAVGSPSTAALRYLVLDSGQSVGVPDVVIMDINHDGQLEWVYAQRGVFSTGGGTPNLVSGKYTDGPPAQVNREQVPLAGLSDAIEPSLLVAGDQNGDGNDDLVIFRGPTGPAQVPGFRLVQRDNSALGSGTGANYASELGDDTLYAIDVDDGTAFSEADLKTSFGGWYAGANESVWSRDTAPIGSGTWCRQEFDNAGSGCTNAIGALGDWNGDDDTDAVRAYAGCNNELGVRSGWPDVCTPGFNGWPNLDRVAASGVADGFKYQPRTCQISNGTVGTLRAQNVLAIGMQIDANVGNENELRIYEYPGAYGNPIVGDPGPDRGEIVNIRGGGAANRWTSVEFADLDGDGILEILAGTYDGKLLVFYRTDPGLDVPVIDALNPIGLGPWATIDILAEYSGPSPSDAPVSGIAVGDLDNDGQVEVLIGNNYPDGDPAAGSRHENAIIIDGLETIDFSSNTGTLPTSTPTATPTPSPTPKICDLRYLTLESQTGTAGVGIPDVVAMDIDHDGQLEIVYAERGITNSLVSLKYADGPPRQTVEESVPLASLNNAIEPRLLGAGDQNGDGLDDLVISGNVNNPGFWLVQRNNAALGSGTIANYAFEAEIREGVPFANDIDVGKALNETGTKTSFGAWFTGWDESVLVRDTAAIGSGSWCMMAYDNAGSGCGEAAGALGDFNGDGFTDGVRSYLGCNNETGVRGNIDQSKPAGSGAEIPLKDPGVCIDNEIYMPVSLDRVAFGLGRFIPRCCRISDGPANTPNGYNVMVAANATSLRVFQYEEILDATPPILYGQPMPSDGTTGNPSPQIQGPNPFEIIFQNLSGEENVNNTSIARFGDLDGDGELEIVIGTYDGRLVACYREDPGAPFGTGGWGLVDLLAGYDQAKNAPVTGVAIADVDGDSQVEVVMSNDFPDASGNTAVTTHVVVIDGLEGCTFTEGTSPQPTATPTQVIPTPTPTELVGVQNWDQY